MRLFFQKCNELKKVSRIPARGRAGIPMSSAISRYFSINEVPSFKNEGKLQTGFATPGEDLKEVCFNRLKSIKVKRIMESGLPPDAFEETVIGVLTRLDFEKRKLPMFTLHSTVDDQKYMGNIHPDLIPQMDSLTFNFRNMEYECKLKVEYTPESVLSKEKYEYTLLDIAEVGDVGV